MFRKLFEAGKSRFFYEEEKEEQKVLMLTEQLGVLLEPPSSSPNEKVLVWNISSRDQNGGNVLDFSWANNRRVCSHHPSLAFLLPLLYSLWGWLQLDASHIGLLYCDNGKTRSGVIVAAFLIWSQILDFSQEEQEEDEEVFGAFVWFYRKRLNLPTLAHRDLISRTPASIQTFLRQFHQLQQTTRHPKHKTRLKAIICRNLPLLQHPPKFCFFDQQQQLLFPNPQLTPVTDWNQQDGFYAILWEHGIVLDGNFTMICCFGQDDSDEEQEDMPLNNNSVMFRYGNSSWFLDPGLVQLRKHDFDMMKQYEEAFDEQDFTIDFVCHPYSTNDDHNDEMIEIYTGNEAVTRGLKQISLQHPVIPNNYMLESFVKMGFPHEAAVFALQIENNVPNLALDYLHEHQQTFHALFTLTNDLSKTTLVIDESLDEIKNTTDGKPQEDCIGSQNDEVVSDCVKKEDDQMAVHNLVQPISATTAVIATSDTIKLDATCENTDSCAAVAPKVKLRQQICGLCKDDDFLLRNQLIACSNGEQCQGHLYYHTNCVKEKKIPFGLSTTNDKLNHQMYVHKKFKTWKCPDCSPTIPMQNQECNTENKIRKTSSPTHRQYMQLKQLLEAQGMSMEQLWSVATNSTPNKQAGCADEPVTQEHQQHDIVMETEIHTTQDKQKIQVSLPPSDHCTLNQDTQEKKVDIAERLKNQLSFGTRTTPPSPSIPFNSVDEQPQNSLSKREAQTKHDGIAQQLEKKLKLLPGSVPITTVKEESVAPENLKKEDIAGKLMNKLKFESRADHSCKSIDVNEANTIRVEEISAALLKDDEDYGKYFKLLKMGMPKAQIVLKMKMEKPDLEAEILDLDPNVDSRPQPKTLIEIEPKLKKYMMLVKMGMPSQQIALKMAAEEPSLNAEVLTQFKMDSVGVKREQIYKIAKQEKKKVKKTPLKIRKKLFWQPIPQDRLSTVENIWKDEEPDKKPLLFDMTEFDALFALNTNDSTTKKPQQLNEENEREKKHLNGEKSIQLIDAKRAMNLAILLSRVKVSFKEIALKVEMFDLNYSDEQLGKKNGNILTLSQLVSLADFLPSPEELKLVSNFLQTNSNREKQLGEAEKFFSSLIGVERYDVKFDILIYKESFENAIKEFGHSLQHIQQACYDVKLSSKLKKLLAIVLHVGNTMNKNEEEDEKETIKGFTVASLLKLGQTKAYNQKTTVLHYIVKLVSEKHPQLLDLESELSHIDKGARESMDLIQADFNKFRQQFTKVTKEYNLCKNKEGHATKQLETFCKAAELKLELLQTELDSVQALTTGMLTYFGEDPTMKPNVFFQTLNTFCLAFQRARKEVLAQQQKQQKQQQNQQKQQKLMKAQSMRFSSSSISSINPLRENQTLRDRSISTEERDM